MIRNFALLLCACASVAATVPARPELCSIAPFPVSRPGLQMIVNATADTLAAGPGAMRYRAEADSPRVIYGQVVRMERACGAEAAGLPAGTDRVVLVPWEHDPGCMRMAWSSSAQWIRPGTRGLIWSSLRAREHWVDGIPTIDVGAAYQAPYVGAGDLPGDSAMSVDQMYDLVARLPESEARVDDGDHPLLRWASANPELARLYPARMMVQEAVYGVRYAQLKRMDPALGGTYRFRVSVDEGAPRTFYARTYSAPVTEWDPLERSDDEPAPLNVPIAGYTLRVSGRSSADSLPAVPDRSGDWGRDGYVSVMAVPDSTAGGVQIWRGEMDLIFLATALPGDSVLVQLSRAEDQAVSRRIMAGEANEPMPVSARFLLRADGSVEMEQESVLSDGRRVKIRGERISRVTIPDPD